MVCTTEISSEKHVSSIEKTKRDRLVTQWVIVDNCLICQWVITKD